MKPSSNSRLTDEDLAGRAQSGDMQAFEELAARYEGVLYGFLHQHLGNAEDARDLAQAVLVRAYRRLHRFDPKRRFRPWIFAITRNVMVDHLRKRPPPRLPSGESVEERHPRRILEESDQAESLWRWVREQLSPEQFTVFWLRVEEDMSIRDLAHSLGRSETAIKVLLFRIRKKLQRGWDESQSATSLHAGSAGHTLRGVML